MSTIALGRRSPRYEIRFTASADTQNEFGWVRDYRNLLGTRAPVEVLEARELLQEGELDRARGAVALLADDDLRQAAVLVGGLVLLLPVDEHHDVRVLLQAARLPQVRELRPLLRARLRGARELAQRHHRDAQLLGQALERPADRGDLLLPVLDPARAGHELQVVDDDQGQPVLRL